MNNVVVANDTPAFLMNVMQTFRYDKLGIIKQGALKIALTIKARSLPQKTGEYAAHYNQSYFAQDVIDIVNTIDYSSLTNNELQKFENEIESAIGGYNA